MDLEAGLIHPVLDEHLPHAVTAGSPSPDPSSAEPCPSSGHHIPCASGSRFAR